MAVDEFYATNSHYKTRMILNSRDSKRDVVGAAAAALDLIKNVEVQAIIGPTTSMEADFTINLREKAEVPIISYSATPSLTSIRSPYFFRATQSDSTQVNAISAIVHTFGWREVVPIYMENEFGEGILPYLADALQAVDVRIPYRSVISPLATDDQIMAELYKLMTVQTRVFIVHMYPSLGKRLFNKAKELGMMSKRYVWLMSDGMTGFLGSSTSLHIESLQGASGVKTYVPKAKELENYRVPWKTKFLQDNPDEVDVELRNYGLWAYDATVALAVAVGQIAATANHGFQKANVSTSSATELDTPGVSRNGQNLLKALANISFKGLSGDSTLPFTESGVSMFVPIVDSKTKNAWVFFKPLTWDLWVTSFCFFIFIGFVVWVLEHSK
ncbi:hypothetical protein Tsubulata_021668 [Turnera subulata]|uniref:Receptor ligand binding region domain-containing protein n=1 Tax=Turnera subulata TaxID=218843 RepID=A0A9Q0FH33_9ROSI|nr:hypothetical protein Tsubulata_021668 [Turnera subulata]